ncbi:unnamed protein product [Clonostachys rhizophaga]|uniref:Terpene synthase n=1 Tax=Clonostachys rhizophaga TaxID=160324 RepID=A0A9N9YWZ7_9HYPO|nr:unnamed protein product [Clonostachys rhizophaga]
MYPPLLMIFRLTAKIMLPEWVTQSAEMGCMWKSISVICMLINDIYSLQKELRNGVAQSAIPILWSASEPNDLDPIVQNLLREIEGAITSFDQATASLGHQYEMKGRSSSDLRAYADACRHIATGLWRWTLSSPRYNMPKYLQPDGMAVIPLGE